MITKFQFKSVDELLNTGIDDYVLLRQKVGLTADARESSKEETLVAERIIYGRPYDM